MYMLLTMCILLLVIHWFLLIVVCGVSCCMWCFLVHPHQPSLSIPPPHTQALQQGPVLIGMDASGLSDIDSDLVQWPSCGNNINHAVMVVGAGTGRDTYGVMTPYWLIRNSWCVCICMVS